MLAIASNTMYNGGMKTITETHFFDSLLGDTFITYTILNPWTGEVVMEDLSYDKLPEMVTYFAWMFGVQESSIIVKKISVSA